MLQNEYFVAKIGFDTAAAVCRTMLHARRNDAFNPLRIIQYTPGHYEGVQWRNQ